MDIRNTKQTQFSPMVLYLPGATSGCDQRRLSREEPGLWKVFNRLSKSDPLTRVTHCEHVPRPIAFPSKDGMKCMCYEKLLKLIKDRAQIPPPQTYRCANGRGVQSRLDGIFPSWTRKALQGYHDNEERQLPLSTLVTRWQQRRYLPNYDIQTLSRIFSRYGKVTEIRPISTNSCLVIFDDVKSACDVMQNRHLGENTNKLHCEWWHRSMANKFVLARANGVSIKTNYFIV